MKLKDFYVKQVAFVLALLGSAYQVNAQLYFSEYAEGSGTNKCVEIYHCGSNSLDLTGWQYRSFQNGNITPQFVIDLSTIQPTIGVGEVIVICNPGAASNATLGSGVVDLFSNSIQFNGNDAIAIYNSVAGVYTDIVGDASSTSNFAKDVTISRSCDVVVDTLFPGSDLLSNWTTGTKDDLSGFGAFAGCSTCPNVSSETSSCSNYEVDANPIISGYFEGSGLNKCIELYNPTCDTICLFNIEYRAYHNGNDSMPTYSAVLGSFKELLAPGETYVICNPGADSAVLATVADTTWNGINHNGNDALELYNLVLDEPADIFGNIGEDSAWFCVSEGADTTYASNVNLTRLVCEGVTENPEAGFPTLCTEWSADTALNSTAGLGSQEACCEAAGKAAISTGVETLSATEGVSVYPNPADDQVTFEFNFDEELVSVEIYSITGMRVGTPVNNLKVNGTSRAQVDVSMLPAGTYVYQVKTRNGIKVGKVSVAK